MYVVVRRYSGSGASQLVDEFANKRAEIEEVISGVSGLVAYTLARTGEGAVSVTVCEDKAGTDESVRVAADWVRQNTTTSAGPPEVAEGEVILQLGRR
jgi:hypothetical protein